jgi:hypothetical protein
MPLVARARAGRVTARTTPADRRRSDPGTFEQVTDHKAVRRAPRCRTRRLRWRGSWSVVTRGCDGSLPGQ